MTRIFLVLATMNGLGLLIATALGVMRFLYPQTETPSAGEPLGATWETAHFLTGLAASLLTLFVHCVIFTYFLGTGRWVKEVARAYSLPDERLPRATREFKRQVFPAALFAMLTAIATVASGAAVQTQQWPWWTHLGLAILTLLVNAWAYVVEYQTVKANGEAIERVMDEVERIREGNQTSGLA